MNDSERCKAGKLYDANKVHDIHWVNAKLALDEFNACGFGDMQKAEQLLRNVFSSAGDGLLVIPPLYYSHGVNISVGDNFFANADFMVLDEADVTIGKNVFIGPRVSIFTACHPISSGVRNTGLQYARPVKIGDNVWIGGNVVINPGVTIGDHVVIGSGSVITKDIEEGVIAAGNPCRVMRRITEDDTKYWNRCYRDYFREDTSL